MHVSLRAGALLARELLAAMGVDDSSSKYAEPDADGVKPVLRTAVHVSISTRYNRYAELTDLSGLIGCPCTLFKRSSLVLQGGSKDWWRGTSRWTIDATSIRHATNILSFTSRIWIELLIKYRPSCLEYYASR